MCKEVSTVGEKYVYKPYGLRQLTKSTFARTINLHNLKLLFYAKWTTKEK